MLIDGVWHDNITCRRCRQRHPAHITCAEAQRIAEESKPKTVPCKWCEKPTTMLGTEMCDGCWELDHRIRAEPELAQRILDHYKENAT